MLRRTELPGAVDDKLYFAQVREDPRLELAALGAHLDTPIVIVGSAGCTALSLVAAGARDVVAVDLNRSQNHLIELKASAAALPPEAAVELLGGAPAADRQATYRRLRSELTPAARGFFDARPAAVESGVLGMGVTERLMRLIAGTVRTAVHPAGRVERLLALSTLDQQREFYRQEWDTARWRLLFRVLCNRLVLRRAYDERFFAQVEDPTFAGHFHRVAEHTLTRLPVRDNYFLHQLLTGRFAPGHPPPYLRRRLPDLTERLALVDGGFTDYLRTRPDASIGAYALSNICEWLTAAEIDELFGQIVRTARPGARLAFRNFVGWTEVPDRWRTVVHEDRELGEELIRSDRSLCQRRIAVCEIG